MQRRRMAWIAVALVVSSMVAVVWSTPAATSISADGRTLSRSSLQASPVANPPDATPVATPLAATPVASLLVDIAAYEYEPAGLRISTGTRVTWVNRDGVTHTVSDPDDAFDSGPMHAGGIFSHTFAEPGFYAYECDLHLQMSGGVTVFDD